MEKRARQEIDHPDRRTRLRQKIAEVLGREIEPPNFAEVTNTDGSKRKLAYYTRGDPNGIPVFLHHGSPGSKLSLIDIFHDNFLQNNHINLITYDRPGYGDSDRQEDRTVADAARDVETIADDLGIDTFFVVGRSGGAPHALACTALLPDRVKGVGFIRGLSPSLIVDGMTTENEQVFGNKKSDLSWIDAIDIQMGQGNIHAVLDHLKLQQDLENPEREALSSPSFKIIRNLIAAGHAYGLINGVDGWKDDISALRKPWGFNLADIRTDIPIFLDFGNFDSFTPHANSYNLLNELVNYQPNGDGSRSGLTTWSPFFDFQWELDNPNSLASIAVPRSPSQGLRRLRSAPVDLSDESSRKILERIANVRLITREVSSHFHYYEDLTDIILWLIGYQQTKDLQPLD